MERFNTLFFNLCFFAVLVGSTYADSATAEILKNDVSDVNTHHADLQKSAENSERSSLNEDHVKDAAQLGQQDTAKDPAYLNKASNAFTSVVHSPSSSDTRHSERIGDREGDASRLDRKQKSVVDLSHDMLLHPGSISARPARQAEKSDATASAEDIPGDAKPRGSVERSIDSSQRSSDLEGDLSVAEDRYQSQYPYWYRAQGQFPNQRYRANDRREPYPSYLRYPVFSGK